VAQHWAVYNLPPECTPLPGGVGKGARAVQLEQGVNDFGHARYDGSCPPAGHGTHHCHSRLAALDTPRLVLLPAAKVADVWRAAESHLLAETELVGTYAH
jgi:Raf kinase inhibitor-like YbhB/YbcL family protein